MRGFLILKVFILYENTNYRKSVKGDKTYT